MRIIAIVFGLAFLAAGIAGFFPTTAPNNMLLGIFHVNVWHNLIHVLTGVLAFYCGVRSSYSSHVFFQLFGVVYALIAGLGFYYGNQPILGVIANNAADNWLHVAVAVFALYIGFGCCRRCCSKSCDNNKDKKS